MDWLAHKLSTEITLLDYARDSVYSVYSVLSVRKIIDSNETYFVLQLVWNRKEPILCILCFLWEKILFTWNFLLSPTSLATHSCSSSV